MIVPFSSGIVNKPSWHLILKLAFCLNALLASVLAGEKSEVCVECLYSLQGQLPPPATPAACISNTSNISNISSLHQQHQQHQQLELTAPTSTSHQENRQFAPTDCNKSPQPTARKRFCGLRQVKLLRMTVWCWHNTVSTTIQQIQSTQSVLPI